MLQIWSKKYQLPDIRFLVLMPGIIRINLLLLCLLLYSSAILPVNAQPFEKQSVIAALTLNLARFTTWPEGVFNKDSPTLNLCVVGDNIVQLSFAIFNNKRVNNKTLHIINLTRLRHLSKCHLIYISQLERKVMMQLLLEIKNRPILTVGENIQFIKTGGMVGLEKVNGKIKLNIHLPLVKQSGLVVSSRILKLATIHRSPFPTH